MSKKIVIITPTRSRPEQLSLVVDCVNAQTMKPDEWVIVDDGPKVPNEILKKITVPYTYYCYDSGLASSTCLNCAKCLEMANAKKYIFFDDDDYYPPCYVENFDLLLENKENVMMGNMRWMDYRLSTAHYRTRFKTKAQIDNGDTMSEWHGSGIVGEELKQEMIKVLHKYPTDKYPDCRCFNDIFKMGRYPCITLDFLEWSCVSLKDYGIGNKGAIKAHRSDEGLTPDDDNYSWFKSKLGEDWKRYEKYLGWAKKTSTF